MYRNPAYPERLTEMCIRNMFIYITNEAPLLISNVSNGNRCLLCVSDLAKGHYWGQGHTSLRWHETLTAVYKHDLHPQTKLHYKITLQHTHVCSRAYNCWLWTGICQENLQLMLIMYMYKKFHTNLPKAVEVVSSTIFWTQTNQPITWYR